ncbi:MAG: hypothetical protein U0175_14215 [Caldilineaceae bacterium]
MNSQQLRRTRIMVTMLILLAELLHLAWEFTQGGVKSHHLLYRADLPAISNGWGILLLPTLSWFLLGRIEKRLLSHSADLDKDSKLPVRITVGFVASLLYGVSLAVAFTQQQEAIASYLFLGMLWVAVLIPVYRSEYMLGFILGMTFTFGAILPTIVASLVAIVSTILHFLVRRIIKFIRPIRYVSVQ